MLLVFGSEQCTDTENVPQLRFNFVQLAELANVEKDATCDIIAVVKEVGELGSITSKATQRPISKRELTLVDKSAYSIRLTLWGKSAETFSTSSAGGDNPIMAFRGVKVGDFGGRSLSMVSSSTMMSEPDIPEAFELRGWFVISSLNFIKRVLNDWLAVQVRQFSGRDQLSILLERRRRSSGRRLQVVRNPNDRPSQGRADRPIRHRSVLQHPSHGHVYQEGQHVVPGLPDRSVQQEARHGGQRLLAVRKVRDDVCCSRVSVRSTLFRVPSCAHGKGG